MSIKKSKNKASYALSVLALVLLHSCGVPRISRKEADTRLPQQYTEMKADSLEVSALSWKSFFKDPYLTDLIDTVLTRNKELNILLQRVAIASNEVQARKGEYLPMVQLGAGAGLEKAGEFTRNGAVEKQLEIRPGEEFPEPLGMLDLGLRASWELDVWKKLRNQKKAAYLEYLASVEGRNFVITNLVAEVASSYMELLALDNQLNNLEQNIQIQQDALRVVKLLQQSGRTNSLAVKRFEAEVQKNQSELYRIKQQIVETENRINFLAGRTPQPILRNSAAFMELDNDWINSGLPSQLLANRPDIRKAEMELEAAKLNVKAAKAQFYPSIGLKAGLGFEAFNGKFLFQSPESLVYGIAGELVAPLINRNAIKAEFSNANARQIEAVYEYEQTIINAYIEVVNQLSRLRNLEQNFSLKEEQVNSLTTSITVANQLFQSARADYMEVLLTQRDALEARMELIETKKDQLVAHIDLYRSLGGGWQ